MVILVVLGVTSRITRNCHSCGCPRTRRDSPAGVPGPGKTLPRVVRAQVVLPRVVRAQVVLPRVVLSRVVQEQEVVYRVVQKQEVVPGPYTQAGVQQGGTGPR